MQSKELNSIKRDENGRIMLGYIPASVETRDEFNGNREKFWYKFDDIDVLFKKSNLDIDTYEDYAELLAEELAKQIGLPTAHYDMAIINDEPGVLSYDFRKGGAFTSGSLILKHYINIARVNEGLEPINTIENGLYNNLQTIEKALSLECSEKQVASIMKNLDLLYGLDCIALQTDRHWNNWGIVTKIDKNGTIKKEFAPQFDGGSLCRFAISKKNIGKKLHYLDMQKRLPQIQKILEVDLIPADFDVSRTLRYDRDLDRDCIGVSRLMKAYEDNPFRFEPVLDKLSQIDTYKAISEVEARIGTNIPEECGLWFHEVVSYNLELMKEKREEIDKAKGIYKSSESRGKAR